jgi:hypothetical protein
MVNNLPIKDYSGVWGQLYQQFLDKVEDILGPLNIAPENSRTCWLYISNKNLYKGGIHHHENTSTVNGVYYFSVPDTSDDRDAAIAFYDPTGKEIFYHKPKECELLIFPNYLLHQPLPTMSDKHRFSINMEIKCDWPETFGDRIY